MLVMRSSGADPYHRGMSGHDHSHAVPVSAGRERRLVIAIVLNVGIVVAQLVAGFVSGSLGLLADAGHNLTDVLAIAVALIAVMLTRRPRTGQRSFGWHRATVLAALFNAASILAVCVFVVYESIERLRDPQPVEGGVVVVFALLGALFNAVAAFVVHDGSSDVNMRGALLHLISDALTSVAVAACGVVMLVTDGAYWLDPAVALVISVLIAWQGWRLARTALDILLESTPDGLDPDAVTTAIEAVDGVDAVHDFHVWSLSSEMRALSAHVVVSGHPTLEEAQVVGARVKEVLAHEFAIAHATLELECEPCADDPHCDADAIPVTATGHAHAH